LADEREPPTEPDDDGPAEHPTPAPEERASRRADAEPPTSVPEERAERASRRADAENPTLRDAASSLSGSSGTGSDAASSLGGSSGTGSDAEPPTSVPEERAERASRRAGGHLRWWAALAILVHLVALYLPGDPQGTIELPWLPGADKVVHLLLFAVPVYLLGRLTRRVGLVAGLFAVHAGVSELVQLWLIPYRDGDVFDALADLTGVVLAVLLLRKRPPRS
jgi:VanZ family protein